MSEQIAESACCEEHFPSAAQPLELQVEHFCPVCGEETYGEWVARQIDSSGADQ